MTEIAGHSLCLRRALNRDEREALAAQLGVIAPEIARLSEDGAVSLALPRRRGALVFVEPQAETLAEEIAS
jgi:hypothetical protein